jgi:hypothetical protein
MQDFVKNTGQVLMLAGGFVFVIFAGLIGLLVVWRILKNEIDISLLISEKDGSASMSRFQLLIFTYVVAMSLFMVVAAATPPSLPKAFPAELLTLLGISGSSYLVSKAIQTGSAVTPSLTISAPPTGTVTSHTFTVNLQNATTGTTMPAIKWSLDAPAYGNITVIGPAQATYTAPSPSPGGSVTLRAKADGFEDATATFAI